MAGGKRASPGSEDFKSPFEAGAQLSDENAQQLTLVQKEIARVELINERAAQIKLAGAYEKRRQVVKAIPNFWAIAMLNHSQIGFHAQHSADKSALAYLEDFWVARDANEPRVYTLEFYFKENPFFSESVLKKEFKLIASPASANETPDADGVTESMLDFSWERDVEHSVTKISWKSEDKNLVKLYPRKSDPEDDDDDMPADAGSFFNFFEHSTDPFDLGLCIANELWTEAIDYFLGNVEGEDSDSEDEDDDDDAAEIDLEAPKSKKQKSA